MEQTKQNKEFIIRYFNAISGVTKTRELLEEYTTDEELISHIVFLTPYSRSTNCLPMR